MNNHKKTKEKVIHELVESQQENNSLMALKEKRAAELVIPILWCG